VSLSPRKLERVCIVAVLAAWVSFWVNSSAFWIAAPEPVLSKTHHTRALSRKDCNFAASVFRKSSEIGREISAGEPCGAGNKPSPTSLLAGGPRYASWSAATRAMLNAASSSRITRKMISGCSKVSDCLARNVPSRTSDADKLRTRHARIGSDLDQIDSKSISGIPGGPSVRPVASLGS
jgi:hypothetical protein